ncbi:MAG: TetR/AcrR family transcriptional regulator [Gemmatimonadota bacterium]|nr:TetR/AcrR family transcriptional regulator [Gemmatimonadota bacterium]
MSTESARERLLSAAARVYAEHGYAGTTTRRVAEAAGVNEVTLFRHFGTKDRLLAEAVQFHTGEMPVVALPDEPMNPLGELAAWCGVHLARLRETRGVLRRCLGDRDQLPNIDAPGEAGLDEAADELRAYVAALRAGGWIGAGLAEEPALAMLLSALMLDAFGREDFPRVFTTPPDEAARHYAATFLNALGASASRKKASA